MLAERGLLMQAPDGTRRNRNHQHFEHTRDAQQPNVIEAEPLTIYHQPAWRAIDPERKPQALMDASARQRDLVALAHATPAAEADQCAAWLSASSSAWGSVWLPAMRPPLSRLVPKLRHAMSSRGHDRRRTRTPLWRGRALMGSCWSLSWRQRVRHCTDGRLVDAPLELWTSVYGVMAEPRWGWLGGIALGS